MNDAVDRLHDVSVPSHRAALRAQLTDLPVTARHPVRRAALAFAAGCLAIAVLTVAYPTWAADLVRFVKIGERTVKGPDGKTYHQQTYQMEGGTQGGGSVQLRANAKGEIIANSVQPGVTPEMKAMRDEAERILQAGHTPLLWEADGMRAYRLTLADGRAITYIQGPGTSWSISQ